MKNKGDFERWFFAVCLLVLLASNTYFTGLAYRDRLAQVERAAERQAAYEEHVDQTQAWLTRQQRLLDGVADSYHADAYDSGVERIAEQQLIAAEYQIMLLQTIAQQNAQMIELMLVAGP